MERDEQSNRRSRNRSASPDSSKRRQSSPVRRRDTPNGRRNYTKMELLSPTNTGPGFNTVIAVFGLMDEQTETDLKEMFMPFGKIKLAAVVMNPRTGRSRGYGFVHFSNAEEAACAKKYWDGVILGRKRIQVNYSYAQQPHGRTPGVYCKRMSHKLVNYRPSFRRSPSSERSTRKNNC